MPSIWALDEDTMHDAAHVQLPTGPMYSENSPVNLKLGASRLVLVLCGTVLIHQQTFFESE